MPSDEVEFKYPRRTVIRTVIRHLTRLIFTAISDFQIVDRENFPATGPLLVVGNHFSFLDPVAVLAISPWPIEFVGGLRIPNAPKGVGALRELWGYYPVYRGTGSQIAFRAAQAVFDQRGILGVFPEGSSAVAVLRPPRPGAAFMAARSQVPILPIGIDGLTDVFPMLRRGRRAKVTIRIGKPFGPFEVLGRGRARRERLDEIGHTFMQRIADLIPASKRGHYSSDPEIRAAAQGTDLYPWDDEPEL